MNKKGFTLIELLVVIALIGLVLNALVSFQRLFVTYQIKHSQLADLQLLGRISLEQMKQEIRQALEIKNTTPDQNYVIGASSMGIVVPNLNTPYLRETAEEIWYSTGTYNGQPNRLLKKLYQYQGGVLIEQPWIPVVVNMNSYRKTLLSGATLEKYFDNPKYQYDNVTVYWNRPERTLAIGIVVTARSGNIVTRLPLVAVVNMRQM